MRRPFTPRLWSSGTRGCVSSVVYLELITFGLADAERSLLNHNTHDLVEGIGGGHGRVLGVGVVRGLQGES